MKDLENLSLKELGGGGIFGTNANIRNDGLSGDMRYFGRLRAKMSCESTRSDTPVCT